MATLLTRGKPYYVKFTTPSSLSPTEGGTISNINIGEKYSFTAGNTVIVSGQFNSAIRFEAVVTAYTSNLISLGDITNITGFPTSNQLYQMTLAGERGSKIRASAGNPNTLNIAGRSGDLYIDSTTGEVYIKS
jgi:hypothetical protein